MTIADMERKLVTLQTRFKNQQAARNYIGASRTRDEYRRLHARWLAAKNQGRML